MIKIDFASLRDKLLNTKIPKPSSGTMSGHAAGEPFDKFVYQELQSMYGSDKVFRQYEYLNSLYQKNPHAITAQEKHKLWNSPTALFLLSRSAAATKKWSENSLFEEKQDDTADILISDGNDYQIIDVKTRNVSKSAQPPNIISSNKLAWMCKYMIDNKEFDCVHIDYIEIDWQLEGDDMVCQDVFTVNMFKIKIEKLYINWASSMQIQFHVSEIDQSFDGTVEQWAYNYLKFYVEDVYRRTEYMVEEYAKPFEPYLEQFVNK